MNLLSQLFHAVNLRDTFGRAGCMQRDWLKGSDLEWNSTSLMYTDSTCHWQCIKGSRVYIYINIYIVFIYIYCNIYHISSIILYRDTIFNAHIFNIVAWNPNVARF